MASDNTNNATQRPYPRIIPDIDNWPIYTLSKDREQLIESVIDETLENILKKNPTEKDIHDELAKAV
ncbi:MAG TPA: hypothetical protein PKC38_06170, partial [Chitinophagales bacterium]|nr:hypothetical protein [Chitinophagales bacterium]